MTTYLHSFACAYPVFPIPFIEKTFISLIGLNALVKNYLYEFCFWTLDSIPLVSVRLYANTILYFLITVAWWYVLKSEVSLLGFVLFKDCFGYMVSLRVQIILEWACLFLEEKHWDFYGDSIEVNRSLSVVLVF